MAGEKRAAAHEPAIGEEAAVGGRSHGDGQPAGVSQTG